MLIDILVIALFSMIGAWLADAIGESFAKGKRYRESQRAMKAWEAARDRELNGPIEELVAQYKAAEEALECSRYLASLHGGDETRLYHQEQERRRLFGLLYKRGAWPIRSK
jgi:hypothetical protein